MKWWAEGETLRPGGQKHNGLDLRLYETASGQVAALSEGTKIPLLYPGRIVSISPDFLAQSIFVENEVNKAGRGKRLFTVYGHLLADARLEGRRLDGGQVIGSLGRPKTNTAPAHLHLSIFLAPEDVPVKKLSWKLLDETPGVVFLDPEGIL
ncbi:MAG: hypothetical protein M0033_06250 [Nitrospiraceae bacterium]|nr:hypothetical protein [Nitrospiraceae bacterium]